MAITAEHFRAYRGQLGFANQSAAKNFFGAKDITPGIDEEYLTNLNTRLIGIVTKINATAPEPVRVSDIEAFCQEHIDGVFRTIWDSGIMPRLNNQGRRPEQVYFNWMRGYVVSQYFLRALSLVFGDELTTLRLIGDDDLTSVDTFKRTPKADLEVELRDGSTIRVEIQSGFTGTNDIKQHKVLEAKRVFAELGIHTIGVHFDLYNGQAAFVKLDEIQEDSVNWITRQQMEGQTVFNIDQNSFAWKLTEMPPRYEEIDFS